MFEIIIFKIETELAQHELESLMDFISLNKQKRIKQLHSIQNVRNSLLGDALARTMICRVTGLSNEQLEFTTNAYGKPLFVNNPNIHFNISHSGNFITCALDDEPVGIDIERIRPIELRIAERFFLAEEKKYVMEKDSNNRFFEVWTKKESRIKWEGKGLNRLRSFCVFNKNEPNTLSYHCVLRDSNIICHACSSKKTKPSIKIIDLASLIKSIL